MSPVTARKAPKFSVCRSPIIGPDTSISGHSLDQSLRSRANRWKVARKNVNGDAESLSSFPLSCSRGKSLLNARIRSTAERMQLIIGPFLCSLRGCFKRANRPFLWRECHGKLRVTIWHSQQAEWSYAEEDIDRIRNAGGREFKSTR